MEEKNKHSIFFFNDTYLRRPMDTIQTDLIVQGAYHDPFQLLGMHPEPGAVLFRTMQPHANSIELVYNTRRFPMIRIRKEGLFEARLETTDNDLSGLHPFNYQYFITYFDGTSLYRNDPYGFLPLLPETDRYLFNSGTNYALYDHMGAHLTMIGGISGVVFRVWAPAARAVSVVGNFNGWDNRVHQLRVLGSSGIWELFVPNISENECYRFRIRTRDNRLLEKSDPFQFYGELRPGTASIVKDIDSYQWNDNHWQERKKNEPAYEKPVAIYEVHPGSWKRDPSDPERFLTFAELAGQLIPHVKELGFTHIELLPIMEHPLDESWGYQVTGPFSLTSRYGTPDDFKHFVDTCHTNGIGVILDWVPAHFPKDACFLARFDGTALFEHEDPRLGCHPEWGTLIFNYGRKEVSNYLIANALFWLDKYHIDGLRVDAVASMLYLDYSRREGEWLPNRYGGRENLDAIEFIKHLNSVIYQHHPNALMIAEESTSFYGVSKPTDMGGLGFGFKWNMGWMNDILNYFSRDPIHRKYHHNTLTFSLMYAFSENFVLPLSHDEVVHGKRSLLDKMPGDIWQKFANLRLLYLIMWCHPGKKLLFMGGEFGQWSEWYCKTSLDWHLLQTDEHHQQLLDFVRELNHLYTSSRPLFEQDYTEKGFRWLELEDRDNSIISFARFGRNPEDHLVCIFNFTPQAFPQYKTGMVSDRRYKIIFSSDAVSFGGSGFGDTGITLQPEKEPSGKAQYSTSLAIPPLAGLILKPV